MSPSAPLIDRYGRVHTYLRVSVTDRCNFRCIYCMPPEGLQWIPRAELLTYEEIGRVAAAFARMGVHKLRITGGEPTIRADIEALIATLGDTPGLTDLAMTTNAHTLAALAPRLAASGLRRVNISLDSLKADRFARLTRGGKLDRVLDGISAARAAGLHPIKINCVLMRGENDDELFDLVDFFAPHAADTQLRFIEYMPFEERRHKTVPSAELRDRRAARSPLLSQGPPRGDAGPARTWRLADSGLVVGFISPLSEHFCASCNRLRLMADGHLRTCLAREDTPSLRDLLRGGADAPALEAAIRAMVMGKPEGHACEVEGGTLFEGTMTGIGG